jgi:serine/threonine-protein kinase
VIFGTHSGGLFRVTAGGEVEAVTPSGGQAPHRFPSVLPDGRGLVFTIGGVPVSDQLAVLPSGSSQWRVVTAGTDGRYLPTGHLVFWREESVWAARFDLDRLQLVGDPVAVVHGVRVAPDGRASFDWSADGSLVYVPRGDVPNRTLVWVDRLGAEAPLAAQPGPYEAPELSPDGSRVLLRYRTASTEDIWIHEITRGTAEPLAARGPFSRRDARVHSTYTRNP